MYRSLKQSGQLDRAAQQAADNTADALVECIHRGMSHDQAWEAVRENWMFLPSEEDQPKLGESGTP
jgi:hypothetical protein